jgi:hypothetical protein
MGLTSSVQDVFGAGNQLQQQTKDKIDEEKKKKLMGLGGITPDVANIFGTPARMTGR